MAPDTVIRSPQAAAEALSTAETPENDSTISFMAQASTVVERKASRWGLAAGLAIGAGLDRWLKTKWITLVGLLVGCVAGFIELIRGIIRASKET